MYAPGDYLAFESPIITASGISTDKKGTIFTISKPGIYQVSFSVRAKSEASTKATSVALELDNAVIEETQTTSTTAEISNAIGIYLIDVKKAGSVLSIKNVSKGKVHILDGLDLIFNINKIS